MPSGSKLHLQRVASSPSQKKHSRPSPPRNATLEDVLATSQLTRRRKRRPNHRAEAQALGELAQTISLSPDAIFQQLADSALRLCGAQSAGISLLEEHEDRAVFRWRATAGAFAPLVGNTLPRDFSPCGAVLDRDALQLMIRPVRHYPYISQLADPVEEVLLVPFRTDGIPIGTVWVVAHNTKTHFDSEDARVVTNLSQFAAAACQALERRSALTAGRRKLRMREREHAQARAELARANERANLNDTQFHAFFDQAPFYAGILTTEGRMSEAGKMALEACGYTREAVIGELFWETPWWRDLPEAQRRIRDAFHEALTGQRFQARLPYVMADGVNRWVDFAMSPVFGENNAIAFIIVTGTDITERVNAETELCTVRRRLDSALLAAEIGTYEWNVVTDRLYGDRNFARIFSSVPVDTSGSAPVASFVNALHPDDRDRVTRSIRHSVETGADYSEDYRIILPEGGERWVHARGRMSKDASDRVVNFFGVVLEITKRKRAEAEREAIADRLRRLTAIHETVLSATNDFAYVFDLEGRFIYANRPLLALYGRSFDDVVGKTFSELGYPDWHAEMHLREIAQVIETRQPLQGEVPFKGESGISGVYDYIFTPVFGADGKIEAVAGTTRDVTERKRGEDRDRLLIALDDTTRPLADPEAITQASARLLGGYLAVNRCAYADVEEDENTFNLTGDFNRDVPSIVGRYRFDQFGADCLRRMRADEPYVVADTETDPRTAAVRESYRATKIRAVICVPLHKAGRFVAAMAVHQTTPRTWLQSEIELLQLVASRCWESIERSRIVRALAESEQRLRLALDTGRLGVWELDLPTQTLSASEQCKAIYGRPAGAPFSYAELLEAVHPEDRERVESVMKESGSRGAEYDIEYRTVWPDHSIHWVLARGQTSRTSDGKLQRLIGVSLDITERKEAESEQVRLRVEAVRASRAKDDFLATLSHELRTPLNPVLLLASDAARDPTLPAEARASFEMIRQNIELEARLIDDLLDLTTIVRGKLAIKKEVRSLHTILTDAVAAVHSDLETKAIALKLELGAAKHTVFVDGVRILQVFINLLKNAAKFTPQGGAVTLATAVEGKSVIAIRLTDSGIGMTSGELSRVFGAFEQGDHANETSSHRFGGLGLGLAISQRLVELHGGTIEATSNGRDRGATFTVKLPLPKTAASGGSNPGIPVPPAARETSVHEGIRILLVEDHEPTRKTLEQLLRRRNYAVVSAASLQEARDRAAAGSFDLVISDLGLPDGDGATLMAELRDQRGLAGIALTGYGMEDDIARCRAAGFATHLTKPIRVEALEAALGEFSDTFRPQR
ncbi:MAG TPA: PAS domain S-box protein [Opitutaceae bacterium]|nr:PAS domain S-box protein [Opitutaceae bacterium]